MVYSCYEETSGLQVAWLPYNNVAGLGAVVMLPPTNIHPADFVSQLNGTKWMLLRSRMNKCSGQVFMPKFTLSGETDLSSSVHKMGVNFSDMPNITDAPLLMGPVLQRVVVEWQESSFSTTTTGTSGPFTFDMKVVRPFIFAICDTTNGYPLFISVVVNPTLYFTK